MSYALRVALDTDASPHWGTPFTQTIYRDMEFPDGATLSTLHVAQAFRCPRHRILRIIQQRDLILGAPLKCHDVLLLLKCSPSFVELLTCGQGGLGDVMGERNFAEFAHFGVMSVIVTHIVSNLYHTERSSSLPSRH
ncbi:hypothetical protein HMPREF3227_01613 [Corynebacterium sp. CMW7794]|nr:hypothetical protein HMPREF0307_01890 [Corynebacterium sp. DNF00584]KXI17389.1 hypothetical protein HMPREF3227_01613 [Corynebacterium sp. CMW7794]